VKIALSNIGAALCAVAMAGTVYARDLGVLVMPVHQGKMTSSLLYEHLKSKDDFDSRGRADFMAHVAGAEFTYGITDQLAVGIKGGRSWIRGWKLKEALGNQERVIYTALTFTMKYFQPRRAGGRDFN